MSVYNSGLTPVLKKRLLMIADHMQKHSMAPTLSELAKKAKKSRGAMQKTVRRLKEKGFLEVTEEREYRNMSLTPKALELIEKEKRNDND